MPVLYMFFKMPPKIKRVVAFVDGQSLYYSAREAFGSLNVNHDVSALVSKICKQQKWELIQTRFYTGIPSPKLDQERSYYRGAQVAQMRSQGVHVFTRELSYQKEVQTLPDGQVKTVHVGREKGVDIRIALDIVKLAHQKTYDIALIFSQDQDLSEVVADVKEISHQQIRSIKLASAFPYSPEAKNKRGINGTNWIEIDRVTYLSCIDPRDYSSKRVKAVTAAKEPTDEERFLTELESTCGLHARQYGEHLLMLVKTRKLELNWSFKDDHSEVMCFCSHQEVSFPVLIFSTSGLLRVPVNNRTNKVIFRGNKFRLGVFQKLNAVPGISFPENNIKEDPSLGIDDLLHTDRIELVIGVIDWLTDLIKSTPIPIPEKKPQRME